MPGRHNSGDVLTEVWNNVIWPRPRPLDGRKESGL